MKLKCKREYDQKTRRAIHKRDDERCLFCEMGYHLPEPPGYPGELQIMHIVPRSQNGMGVEQNGVLGCAYHHREMDNGNKGLRTEMLQILEDYMRSHYPGWTRDSLIYHKHPDYQKKSAGSRPVEEKDPEKSTLAAGFIPVEGVNGEIPI